MKSEGVIITGQRYPAFAIIDAVTGSVMGFAMCLQFQVRSTSIPLDEDIARWRDFLPPLKRRSLLDGDMLQRGLATVQVTPERRLAIDLQSLSCFVHRRHSPPKDTLPLNGKYYT